MEYSIFMWRDMELRISNKEIYSFSDLDLSFGLKVVKKQSKKEEFAEKEYTQTQSLNIEVPLNVRLGIDVEAEISRWKERSQDGVAARAYIGGNDIIGYAIMLSSCNIKDIRMNAGGTITACKLSLKFERQEDPNTEGEGGGSGGGGTGGPKKKKRAEIIGENFYSALNLLEQNAIGNYTVNGVKISDIDKQRQRQIEFANQNKDNLVWSSDMASRLKDKTANILTPGLSSKIPPSLRVNFDNNKVKTADKSTGAKPRSMFRPVVVPKKKK